jgi:hypothetical protein
VGAVVKEGCRVVWVLRHGGGALSDGVGEERSRGKGRIGANGLRGGFWEWLTMCRRSLLFAAFPSFLWVDTYRGSESDGS